MFRAPHGTSFTPLFTQCSPIIQHVVARLRPGLTRYAQPIPKFIHTERLICHMVLPSPDLQQEPDQVYPFEGGAEMPHDAAEDVHHQLRILTSKAQTHEHDRDQVLFHDNEIHPGQDSDGGATTPCVTKEVIRFLGPRGRKVTLQIISVVVHVTIDN